MAKNPLLQKFGESLKEARLDRGLSQEQLAMKSKLSRNFIGMLERGERNITILSADKLAKVLGLKIKDLLDF